MALDQPPNELGLCTQANYDLILSLLDHDAVAAATVCADFDVSVGVTNSVLLWAVKQIHRSQAAEVETRYGLDTAFLLQSGYNVFIMVGQGLKCM